MGVRETNNKPLQENKKTMTQIDMTKIFLDELAKRCHSDSNNIIVDNKEEREGMSALAINIDKYIRGLE